MDDDLMLSRMILSTCNLAAMLPQGVARFRKRMQEYEDFSKKKEKMKSSMSAMKKEIAGFVEKEAAWDKKVSDLTRMHEIEMSDLKKMLSSLQVPINRSVLCTVLLALLHHRLLCTNKQLSSG
ncbi:hypothetical protein Hdeb2414_s0009g00306911 [Helianthus debilis subsp. tardiflorus]